jgi:thiamine-monophosphate kinase
VPLQEKSLIRQIRRRTRASSHGLSGSGTNGEHAAVLRGVGDDAALIGIPPADQVLVTTDFSLENIHFRRQWHPPESVGHRCLARGLSDIAAMGGIPVAAFLSLALPRDISQVWVNGFIRGLLALGGRFKTVLAGGDTAESPSGVLADIVVLGSVPKGTAVLRSGAKAGHAIYVSGELGGSALALKQLKSGRKLKPTRYPAHFFPVPRVPLGQALRDRKVASSMIDISDGLSTDLDHICEESRVGARIYAERIPMAKGADLSLALHGGEDYELLFTVPANRHVPDHIAGVQITRIGEITRGRRIILVKSGHESVLPVSGWEHFRTRQET